MWFPIPARDSRKVDRVVRLVVSSERVISAARVARGPEYLLRKTRTRCQRWSRLLWLCAGAGGMATASRWLEERGA